MLTNTKTCVCGAEEETEDLGKKRSDLQFFAFYMSLYTYMHDTMQKHLGRRERDPPPLSPKKVLYVEYSYILYIFLVDGCTVV